MPVTTGIADQDLGQDDMHLAWIVTDERTSYMVAYTRSKPKLVVKEWTDDACM
jgi:hypothetical protein